MADKTRFGLWWEPHTPTAKVSGQLSQEPRRFPELSLVNPPDDMWAGPALAAGGVVGLGDHAIPIVHGETDQGGMTLLDCHQAGLQWNAAMTHRFRVACAIEGVWLDAPDEKFIRRVEVELPALEALLGPGLAMDRPTRRTSRLTIRTADRRFKWRDGEIEITWEYKWTANAGDTAVDIRTAPRVTLTSRSPRALDYWVTEWLNPMNQLCAIAAGGKSNPRSLSVWMKKNVRSVERATTELPVWMRGVGDHEYEFDRFEVLFGASTIDGTTGGLPSVLSATRRLTDDHPVFLGLLSDVLSNPDRPLRNRYLDMTAAIEAYDAQVRGLGPVPEATFKAARRRALIAATGIDSVDIKFLKRWVPRRSHYSLEARLDHVRRSVDGSITWGVKANRMAALRNDIAHGNPVTSQAELSTAFDQAFRLARLIVMSEVGIT